MEAPSLLIKLKNLTLSLGNMSMCYENVKVICAININSEANKLQVLDQKGEQVFLFTKDNLYPRAPMRQALTWTQFNFSDFMFKNHPVTSAVFNCYNEADNVTFKLWYDDVETLRLFYAPHQAPIDSEAHAAYVGSQRS